MAILAFAGSLAQPGSPGNQVITGVGFTPKIVFFWMNSLTADGTGVHARRAFGVGISSTDRRYMAVASADASAASNCSRRYDNTRCIGHITEGGAAPTVNAEADLVSLDADGFTINWITVDATARVVEYLVLGGGDLTGVASGDFNSNAGVGNQIVTHSGGFTGGCLILCGATGTGAAPLSEADATFGVGFAVSTSARGASMNSSDDALATTNTARHQRDDRCWAQPNFAGTSEFRVADFVSFASGEFTINWTVISSAAKLFFVVLAGGRYGVGSFTVPGAPGAQSVTAPGFLPAAVLFSSINNTALTTTPTQNARLTLGAAVSSTQRFTAWAGDQDAAADSICDQDLDRTKCLRMLTEGTPTLNDSADFTSQNPTGFTINWDTVSGTAKQVIYLALGTDVTVEAPIGISRPTGARGTLYWSESAGPFQPAAAPDAPVDHGQQYTPRTVRATPYWHEPAAPFQAAAPAAPVEHAQQFTPRTSRATPYWAEAAGPFQPAVLEAPVEHVQQYRPACARAAPYWAESTAPFQPAAPEAPVEHVQQYLPARARATPYWSEAATPWLADLPGLAQQFAPARLRSAPYSFVEAPHVEAAALPDTSWIWSDPGLPRKAADRRWLAGATIDPVILGQPEAALLDWYMQAYMPRARPNRVHLQPWLAQDSETPVVAVTPAFLPLLYVGR